MAQKCYTLLIRVFFAALIMTATMIHAERADQSRKPISKPTVNDTKLLDVNEIECFIQNCGPLGENPATGGDGFFYPKGQRERSIIYTAGLWVIGKLDGDIRSAVCQYSTEFQPGMILPDGGSDDTTDPKYKVYKYNKNDVIDQEALDQGCPAEVLGDQMLFAVYNDLASHAGVYTKAPVGIEVQQTAFAFNRTGALGKTIFVRYRFINKNKDGKTLEDAYVGVFFDPDLGDAEDDATGSDAELGIAYVYNGDDFDNKYGAGPPALCSDFFQGPLVDAPGETAVLPDGTEIPDKKILSMTSYFTFIKNSDLAGLGDPELESAQGATEAYFFVQGFRGNGETWDDPIAGTTTKFPLNGDPVAGTGWLFRHITAPTDVRMGNASGPFQLEPGVPQDVVVGLVVGDGPTNLASVQLMKYNDAQAQMAYNLNFELPDVPPSPILEVGQYDGELALTWDDAAASFDSKGYAFEGFNIYMAETSSGPWTRVTTLDVENSITAIWDQEFDVNLAAIIEKPVQFGSDTGIKYAYHIDKDYVNNLPLVNGKKYYFAVTSYAYNETGTPRALETAKVACRGIPQRPVLDEVHHSDINDEIAVEHTVGISDGRVNVTVVDPAKVTGHSYKVQFYNLDSGDLAYKIVDADDGRTLVEDVTRLSMDDNYLAMDGLIIKVDGPPLTGKDWDYEGERWVSYDDAHDANWGCLMWGSAFLGGEFWDTVEWTEVPVSEMKNINFDFFAVTEYADTSGNGEYDLGEPYTVDPEKGQIANTYSTWSAGHHNGQILVPFKVYDIEADPPRQLDVVVRDRNGNGQWDLDDGNVRYEYLWVLDTDYNPDNWNPNAGGRDFMEALDETGGPVLWSFWWGPRGDRDYTTADFSMHFLANHVIVPNEEYAFSTAGYETVKTAENAKMRLDDINVFPNPYFGHNLAEDNFFTQFVTFNNLPEDNCTIRIFSLSGTLVTTIEHNDGTPFERWYLLNSEELPVASGMYIVHVETEFGNKILKLGVVNREARYQHM